MISGFQQLKIALAEASGLTQDALHIHVGLIVLVLASWLGRWRIGDWRPLAIVLIAAVAGEIWDGIDAMRADAPPNWGHHWRDLGNTLFWPAMISLLVRTRLFRQGR